MRAISKDSSRIKDGNQQTSTSMMDYVTRYATLSDVRHIIDLSQASLVAKGSLQEVGPLDEDGVNNAIEHGRGFVLESQDHRIVGCAFSKPVGQECFATTSTFSMNDYPKPWLFLHWVMLEPGLQGRGIGAPFIRDVLENLQSRGHSNGTLLLDCWAGNTKLRSFYTRLGFTFAAVVPQEDYEIAVFYLELADKTSFDSKCEVASA